MIKLFNETKNVLERINYADNIVVFSSLREFYHPIKSKGFAIKYVFEGSEKYIINGQKYDVKAGKYLLTNYLLEGSVEIESNKNVKGICINIIPSMLTEVVASMKRPDTAFSDASLGEFFSTTDFLENHYDANQTQLGGVLSRMGLSAQKNHLSTDIFNQEFFYQLSEKIVADQLPIFKQLQQIPTIKSATKKDLYKRVSLGREFIDNAFFMPLTIELVAKEACMSEYHFFRIFKLVYGLTPHQYILQKRLEHSQKILQQDRYSVSEAAIESGFADIYAFSKAFKNHFGVSPTLFLKQN